MIFKFYFKYFLTFSPGPHERTINVYQNQKNIYKLLSRSDWEDFFKDSYTAHFYQSSSKTVVKVMKKKFYGSAFPAYLPLAMQHCPISFNSERMF